MLWRGGRVGVEIGIRPGICRRAGRRDDRHARPGELIDDRDELRRDRRVEIFEQIVEQQQRRPVHECARQRDAARLAARQVGTTDPAEAIRIQAYEFERRACAPQPLVGADVGHPRRERHVVQHAVPGQ